MSDWPPEPVSVLLFARRRGEPEWTPIWPVQLKGFSRHDGYEFKAEVQDGRLCPPGHVLMPHSDEEAKMMHLIAEQYIRTAEQGRGTQE